MLNYTVKRPNFTWQCGNRFKAR